MSSNRINLEVEDSSRCTVLLLRTEKHSLEIKCLGRKLLKHQRPGARIFDMTTLIFSIGGGAPRTLFIPLKGALGTLSSWLATEKPSREVATKDHWSLNPTKGDISKPCYLVLTN